MFSFSQIGEIQTKAILRYTQYFSFTRLAKIQTSGNVVSKATRKKKTSFPLGERLNGLQLYVGEVGNNF